MSEPKRIQRKRTKGWRMPEGAVYVGRPGKWGNPFAKDGRGYHWDYLDAVAHFRYWFFGPMDDYMGVKHQTMHSLRGELRGKDLACWCPLDQPCHADVLIEWANS